MHLSLSSWHLLTSCDGFSVSNSEFFRKRCKQSNCCHVFKESEDWDTAQWLDAYLPWMKCWVQFTVLLGGGDGESERQGEGIRESLILFLLHLTFTCIFIFLHAWRLCLHVYVCTLYLTYTHGHQRGHYTPSCWRLLASMRVLGTEPQTSSKAVNTLKHRAISPASSFFKCIIFSKGCS